MSCKISEFAPALTVPGGHSIPCCFAPGSAKLAAFRIVFACRPVTRRTGKEIAAGAQPPYCPTGSATAEITAAPVGARRLGRSSRDKAP